MTDSSTCKMCETRVARRSCIGKRVSEGDAAVEIGVICPACCGKERENTILCPLECVFLRQARTHEKHGGLDPASIPNRDVDVSEQFLRDHEREFLGLGQALAEVMIQERSADPDAAAAIEDLIRSYQQEEPGAGKQTPLAEPGAIKIREHLLERMQTLSQPAEESEESKVHALDSPAEWVKILAFMQRLILQEANGRRHGRRFFEFALSVFALPPDEPISEAEASEAR